MRVRHGNIELFSKEQCYSEERVAYGVNIYNSGNKNFKKFEYRTPPCYIIDIMDAIILPGSTEWGSQCIIKDNLIYTSTIANQATSFHINSQYWDYFRFDVPFHVHIENKETVELDFHVVPMFNIQQYWHWFMEQLPLILIMMQRKYGAKFLFNTLTDWQRESLKLAAPDIKFIEYDTQKVIKASKVSVITYPSISDGGKCNPRIIRNIRKSLMDSLTFGAPGEEFLYVSRSDSKAKRILNEDELLERLADAGHEIKKVVLSEYSLEEKIKMFDSAACVIGPTGAGLTHCMFMRSGTTVIDINHDFYVNHEYGWNSIGDAIDLKWHTIATRKPVASSDIRNNKEKNWDMRLTGDDINKIRILVQGVKNEENFIDRTNSKFNEWDV